MNQLIQDYPSQAQDHLTQLNRYREALALTNEVYQGIRQQEDPNDELLLHWRTDLDHAEEQWSQAPPIQWTRSLLPPQRSLQTSKALPENQETPHEEVTANALKAEARKQVKKTRAQKLTRNKKSRNWRSKTKRTPVKTPQKAKTSPSKKSVNTDIPLLHID